MVECWLCLRVEGGRGGELADFATCLAGWRAPDRSSPSSGIFPGENMPQWYDVAHRREPQLLKEGETVSKVGMFEYFRRALELLDHSGRGGKTEPI